MIGTIRCSRNRYILLISITLLSPDYLLIDNTSLIIAYAVVNNLLQLNHRPD